MLCVCACVGVGECIIIISGTTGFGGKALLPALDSFYSVYTVGEVLRSTALYGDHSPDPNHHQSTDEVWRNNPHIHSIVRSTGRVGPRSWVI